VHCLALVNDRYSLLCLKLGCHKSHQKIWLNWARLEATNSEMFRILRLDEKPIQLYIMQLPRDVRVIKPKDYLTTLFNSMQANSFIEMHRVAWSERAFMELLANIIPDDRSLARVDSFAVPHQPEDRCGGAYLNGTWDCGCIARSRTHTWLPETLSPLPWRQPS